VKVKTVQTCSWGQWKCFSWNTHHTVSISFLKTLHLFQHDNFFSIYWYFSYQYILVSSLSMWPFYFIIICLCQQNIIEISLSRKICCQNCQECNTFCVTTFFFLWISRVCQIKNIKYINQNLRYYETIVQLLYL
jgi:hypothetical protein